MKYSLDKIAKICSGTLIGADCAVESVSTDSRSFSLGVNPMFIAINGANHDGHEYVADLYQRGVRAFMIEKEVDATKFPDAGFVRIGNSVEALQSLAADYRKDFKGTVVAITGSNGKTVVKEWIAQICPEYVKLFRSPKSFNSQIGVPLSVLMIKGDEQIAVIEAGISKCGEMSALERVIRPDIGIITTIGDAHQENFENTNTKLNQKLELFKNSKTIIYNSDYQQIKEAVKSKYPQVKNLDAAQQTDVYKMFSDKASQENAASAVSLYDVLGFGHSETIERLKYLQPVAMRLELKDGIHGSIIVNDSYNSDINSLTIALDYLKNIAGERPQMLILSDILQSGLSDEELYNKVASLITASGVNHLVAIGDRIRGSRVKFPCRTDFFPNTESAMSILSRENIEGQAILIKGNRNSQFEKISHAIQLKSHATMLEIDLDAMIHNLNVHRAMLTGGTKMMAMVKASGYGNGDFEVANMLQHQGVDYLAVAFADEGVLLRKRGITMPIVVLNSDEDSFELMIDNNLEPEIYSFTSLESFLSILKRHSEREYLIHIKLDTGMHRLGFEQKDIEPLCEVLDKNYHLIRVKSIFAHLAASDEPKHDEFTRSQITLFSAMSEKVMSILPYKALRHIANSAAIERFPQAQFDMCRLGIGLYGIGAREGLNLLSVSTLTTRIVQIKELPAGDSIGYGRATMLTRPTRSATIPMGYADGLNRHLGCGSWSVMVNDKPAPVLGRICMDTCMVDITDIDANVGDKVVIFGAQPGNKVEDMACALDTIPYEVMTSISARVKRIYIKE